MTRVLWILPAKPSGAAATAGWEEEPPPPTSAVRGTYPSMTSQTSTFEPSLKYGELGAGSGMWGRCSSHSHAPLGAADLIYIGTSQFADSRCSGSGCECRVWVYQLLRGAEKLQIDGPFEDIKLSTTLDTVTCHPQHTVAYHARHTVSYPPP